MSDSVSEKNFWDKLDVLIKGFGLVLVSGVIGFYGHYSRNQQASDALESRNQQAEIAQRNRNAEILVETMRSREAAAATMRANMFKTLVEYYFQNKEDESSQVVTLEMIGLNFQDQLHVKPLFQKLDKSLQDPENKLALRKAARNIVRSEINKIVGNGGEVCEFHLNLEASNNNEAAGSIVSENECASELDPVLVEIYDDKVEIRTNGNAEGFDVTFYDTPLIDNSTINEWTFSLVLTELSADYKSAKLKLVTLPEHFYGGQNQLKFDQLIGELMVEITESDEIL